MKTKTKFATTSDVRNLINATMETFPKGPERDGIQTKMFNFWDNFNAGNNLPAGSDRKRFLAEAFNNAGAALRIAQRLDNEGNKGCVMKVTVLESKLTGIKVGKNEMAKVEDNFYGKRVVKGIFAKAKFDKSNYYALEGTVDGNATGSKTVETIEEAMYYGKAMLEHMKKQSPKAKVATVHIFKVVNYQRENTPVKVLNSRTGSKAKFATKPTRKFKGGDRVAVLSDGKVVAKGIIDYLFDYDDYVGTYIYKVRQDDGGRASYNETSLKKMSRTGAKVFK